jgi:hypothetical protein
MLDNENNAINDENINTNNHQENIHNNFEDPTISMEQMAQSYNQLYIQVQKQILEYRGRLKQLEGQKQLTNNNQKNEKQKIKKAIARLNSILKNPSAMIKFFKDMERNQQLFQEAVEQMKALESQKEDKENAQESSDENKQSSKKTKTKKIESEEKAMN